MSDLRIKSLIVNNKKIKNQNVTNILSGLGFNWLLESEFDNAELEIKNNTLIWKNGIYYYGNWFYGIFLNGTFYGNFLSGVFKKGIFKGKRLGGVFAIEDGFDS